MSTRITVKGFLKSASNVQKTLDFYCTFSKQQVTVILRKLCFAKSIQLVFNGNIQALLSKSGFNAITYNKFHVYSSAESLNFELASY